MVDELKTSPVKHTYFTNWRRSGYPFIIELVLNESLIFSELWSVIQERYKNLYIFLLAFLFRHKNIIKMYVW